MNDSTPITPPSATLDCPNCHTTITYYDVTGSSFYACPNCRTLFEYEYEGPPRIIQTFAPTSDKTPLIPLGSEGAQAGNLYRVVGFMRKTEAGSSAEWREYVLYSPIAGYAQLAEYNGHWQFIRPADESDYYITKEFARSWYIKADDRHYQLFHTYQPRLLYAVGEFDWNILDDEQLTISEFISPPFMLTQEQHNETKSDWYKAEHRSPQAIADAFGLSADALPQPLGVGAIQPADEKNVWQPLASLTSIALGALLLIMLVFNLFRSSPRLLNESFLASPNTSSVDGQQTNPPSPNQVSKSFAVTGEAALGFDLHADVDNNWVELAVELVNDKTGQIHSFTKSIEYYHGRESGENWTEGSQDESAVLSRIPPGQYHLLIEPSTDALTPVSFSVRVVQNTTLFSNSILVILVLLVYPVYVYWQTRSIDRRRWSESDYGAQYDNEEDNDD